MKTFDLIGTLLEMKTSLKPEEKIVFYRKSVPYVIKKTWWEMLTVKMFSFFKRKEQNEMKIIKSIWFTNTTCHGKTIGIVICEDKLKKKKAYFGCGLGIFQKEDEVSISKYGSPFPIECIKELS